MEQPIKLKMSSLPVLMLQSVDHFLKSINLNELQPIFQKRPDITLGNVQLAIEVLVENSTDLGIQERFKKGISRIRNIPKTQKFILLPEGVAPSKSTINASPSNETFQETVNRPSVNKSTLDESTAASHTALPSIKTVEEKVDGPRINIFANDFNGECSKNLSQQDANFSSLTEVQSQGKKTVSGPTLKNPHKTYNKKGKEPPPAKKPKYVTVVRKKGQSFADALLGALDGENTSAVADDSSSENEGTESALTGKYLPPTRPTSDGPQSTEEIEPNEEIASPPSPKRRKTSKGVLREIKPIDENCDAYIKTFQCVESFKTKQKVAIDFKNYDVRQALLKHDPGTMLLGRWLIYHELDDHDRTILVDEIIRDLFSQKYDYLDVPEYIDLANNIVNTFPGEEFKTYYIRAQTFKDQDGKTVHVPATGRLPIKVHNQRKEARDSGLITSNRGTALLDDISTLGFSKEKTDEIDWLESGLHPWERVLNLWTGTFELRKKYFANQANNNFQSYAGLRQCLGYQLINIDFQLLHGEQKSTSLTRNFNDIFHRLLDYNNSKKKAIQANLKLIKDCASLLTEDAITLNKLLCLPSFIAPTNRVAGARVSVADCLKYFVNVVATEEEVTAYQADLKKISTSEYPAAGVVVMQTSKEDIDNIFLLIGDRYKYQIPKVLDAVDVAFKYHNVFNVPYAQCTLQLYMFLQRGVYKILKKNDREFSNVETLVKKLNDL